MNPTILSKLPDVVNKLTNVVDDSYMSQEEANATLTERLISDNSSESWIPKAIRPFLGMFFSALYGYLAITGINAGMGNYDTIMMTTGTIVTAIVYFYFTGRNKLKIVNSQAKAAIEITRLETRHVIKQEKKDKKLERKIKRKDKKKWQEQDNQSTTLTGKEDL